MAMAEVKDIGILLEEDTIKRVKEVFKGERRDMCAILIVRDFETYRETGECYNLWQIIRDRRIERATKYRCILRNKLVSIY